VVRGGRVATDLPQQPRRKRVGRPPGRGSAGSARRRQEDSGSAQQQAKAQQPWLSTIQTLHQPPPREFFDRCVVPALPALLKGVVSEAACAVAAPPALREALRAAGALTREVEVAVADRGGVFFGDDFRREASSMPIGDFLDLLEVRADTFQGKQDMYLCQCAFRLPGKGPAAVAQEPEAETETARAAPKQPEAPLLPLPSARLAAEDGSHGAKESEAPPPVGVNGMDQDVPSGSARDSKEEGTTQSPSLEGSSHASAASSAAPLEALADTLALPTCLPGTRASGPGAPLPGFSPQDVEGNLWACHRQATTNAHYDGRHNILAVLRGAKTITLWSPADTLRLRPASIASLASHHMASPDATPTGLLDSRLHKFAPVTLQAGDALFIPEGWWHQVESTPGTVAANYWFPGTHHAVSQACAHQAPFLLRSLAQDLLWSSRRRLVHAFREEQAANPAILNLLPQDKALAATSDASRSTVCGDHVLVAVTEFSVPLLGAAMQADPGHALKMVSRAMPLPAMLDLLPAVVQSYPQLWLKGVEALSFWEAELLTGSWSLAEAGQWDLTDFYAAIFDEDSEPCRQAQKLLVDKQYQCGLRLLPLILSEFGILESPPLASLEEGSASHPEAATTKHDALGTDLHEVRCLITRIGASNVLLSSSRE